MEKSKLAFSLLLCALIFKVTLCYVGTSSDKFALLQFKSAISADPSGLLSNWNPSDESPCSWNGVTCNSKTRRVSSLELSCNPYSTIPGNLNLNSNFIPCLRLGFDFYGKGSSVCFSNRTSSDSNSGNRTDCKLTGKLSPFIGELSEIRVLSLSFNEFFSEVPREIGRLRLLEVLELGGNRFMGSLPRELGDLRSLRVLDLGFNDFIGEIPASIANCDMLQNVSFAGNRLNGTVPAFFVGFRKLRSVSLSFNRLSGSIPDDLGQECEFLQHLHLAGNYLTGSIPIGLGNCSKLRSLLLFSNMLDSGIPPDLGRLLMLQVLDLSRNFLSGVIPAELGNCRQLKVLILKNIFNPMLFGNNVEMDTRNSSNYTGDYNYFEGGIPDSVVILPNLRILWAPNLNLEGIFPQNWGPCSSLQMVNFAQNFFTGEIPASLGKCKSLYHLDLSFNQLSGRLPKEIPVSCMVMFNVSGNLLVGDIPSFSQNGCHKVFVPFENRGSMVTLNPLFDLSVYYSYFYYTSHENTLGFASASNHLAIFHDFSRNRFTGPIPPMPLASDRLLAKPVYEFLLNGNKLEGSIPGYLFDLCSHLDSLIIDLGENKISGELPLDIGNRCKCIKYLGLAGNGLVGSVPPSFEHLVSLVYLDLSRNKLQGQIPAHFGQMKDLRYLSLSGNRFNGNIPLELAQLSPLEVLKLSSNSLTGDIPFVFAKLVNLSVLQLDNNKLSGHIPSSFGNITSLSVFNVSFNNLSGPIPPNMIWIKCDAIQGNPNLQPCRVTSKSSSPSEEFPGVPRSFAYSPARSMSMKSHHRFSSAEIASIISAFVIVSVLLVLVILFFFMRMCVPRSGGQGLGRKDVITFHNNGFQLTYETIVRATAGFSVQNCIGNGGFGATYRAEVTPNVAVAVKRLAVGRFQGIQQFKAEIRTLGRVRHPNLVTLIGYHVSEAEMFLIYNYLPGGNLEKFIQDRSKRPVNWSMLHKIALDIAHALAYLHDECVPRILHRDIKPSNILLDNNFNAYLSDFGLARLLGTSETHATTDVAGTFGYVAPEYAMTCRVSDKADVYSYGIVLLELISDKRALDPSFSCYGNGFNIVTWVCMLLRQGRASEFFVAGLWDNGPHADLTETLHLAVMCTVDSLLSRPSMKQVVQRLKQIEPLTC